MSSTAARKGRRLPAAFLGVALLLGGCGGSSHAISPNLGPIATDVPEQSEANFGFQPAGPVLRSRGRVEMLVIDTSWDVGSSFDRWAEVKALNQFGTWQGIRASTVNVPNGKYLTFVVVPQWPTLDLSSARYSSRFVAFVHRVIQVKQDRPLEKLPATDQVLLSRFGHLGETAYPQKISPWPVIIAGGFAMHGIVSNPPESFSGSAVVTFRWLRKEISGNVDDPEQRYWLTPLNDFASTLVAVICHADGQRPASTCSRPVIRTIEHRLP